MIEYKLLVDDRAAESLADFLLEEGAYSATIEDADADRPEEQPLYGEPGMEPEQCAWPRSRLSILTEADFPLEALLKSASNDLEGEMPEILSCETVPEQDWVRVTQAQFQPTKVSDRLWIVPTWHDCPNSEAINVRLDPGVAFGTGSHPTTHLCLQWLDAHVTADSEVLDYGCGTGILAIAAKLLGAKTVTGTDIDPQAVEAALDNAKMNEVEAHFVLPDDLKSQQFPMVVANILANPLKVLAPALLGRVAAGGSLVLSGILSPQADEIIACYQSLEPSLKLSVWKEENGWVCIAGQKSN